MNLQSSTSRAEVVSIHPYFRAHPGKLDAAKQVLRKFVAKTTREPKVLYYDFTINGEEIYCREAYVGPDGLIEHLSNVGPELEEMLSVVDLVRLEIHASAAAMPLLKEKFDHLKPSYWVFECGLQR